MGEFTCSECGLTESYGSDLTTGYGVNTEGDKVCYSCCAEEDKAWMEKHNRITLYFSEKGEVTNWPGSLRIPCIYSVGKHNWGLVRHDVWFTDHTGAKWWGVHIGHMTDLVHCRKLKA